MRKILKNLGYQTLYQILAICLPLFTTPYISRVLGAEGLGIYSYTYSVVNYFSIFAMLGTLNYGIRQIAIVKEDSEKTKKTFWSIYLFQLCASLLSLACYLLFILLFVKENRFVALTQVVWLLACTVDINWFFFGIEEFEITVKKNTIIKLLTFAAIFLIVRDSDDIWVYTLIMSLGTVLSGVVLWPRLIGKIGVYHPKLSEVIQHIRPNLTLFIPFLGLSIYHIMDKTMLGIVCSYDEGGYYYNADKVMNMPLTVIIAMGTVMLPKMSELVAKGEKEAEQRLFNLSIEAFMCLTIGMAFGISAVADLFVPIFFGEGYETCVSLVYVFSIVMVFKALADIIRNQYLIPHSMEKTYTISVFVGALTNFVANGIFIVLLRLGALGACLGTLVAEAVTCVIGVVAICNYSKVLSGIKNSIVYIFFGAAMWLLLSLLKMEITIANLLIKIVCGGLIYVMLCIAYVYKNDRSILHGILHRKQFK